MGRLDELVGKLTGKKDQGRMMSTTVSDKYEINLVPEVKHQMIKTQKLRNFVLFICIVVGVASVGAVVILFGVKSGQDVLMANQDKKLETMSAKLLGYDELGDLVTIQGQLGKLQELSENKRVLSRVFGALGAMLPTGGDVVQLSELRVNLEESTLKMEAQADARTAPLIDYRVLESFKKGVALAKYDYGRYVDAKGNEIPTWCINESGDDGKAYRDGESYYAWWNLKAEGCAAVPLEENEQKDDENGATLYYDKDAETEKKDDKVERVKIWRTLQFDKWHRSGKMELNGEVSGIEHFESACIKYSGVAQGSDATKWSTTNDCMLAPEGLEVTSSSNGRDESNNLVLRFTANLTVEPEFFAFRNKHVMAIGPVGQNVTDSYVQVGGMFTQPATECAEGDNECKNSENKDGKNEKGGNE